MTKEGQVNAHSSIDATRESAVMRRLRSRAYRAGLAAGFGAPGLFYSPLIRKRTNYEPSVAASWKAVGDALRSTWTYEAKKLGKTTRKTRTPR